MESDTVCCPKFDPAPWDGKVFNWKDKKFIKDKVFTLFFIPINFGSVVKRMTTKMDKAGAKALDWLSLSDHVSKWNMDLYIAVDREILGAENVTLSGKFLSKVYVVCYLSQMRQKIWQELCGGYWEIK
jgi:hypothetical protein